jgi:hypothetical protein
MGTKNSVQKNHTKPSSKTGFKSGLKTRPTCFGWGMEVKNGRDFAFDLKAAKRTGKERPKRKPLGAE